MSGLPELEQGYSLARFVQARQKIPQMMTAMVLHRARIEKYRTSDIEAARGSYSMLQSLREGLATALRELSCDLMEIEAYGLARTAEQLSAGLSGFDLMSSIYRPVYDAVCQFAERLPNGEKVDAAAIGHLMNTVRLGYYPTDPENIDHILRGIKFPDGITTNLLDPCCGCGKALRQMAQGNNCYAYGVELDQSRAEEAQTRLHRVGFGSYFYSRISREAFHLLFLNPPYISVLSEGGKSRYEKRFLIDSMGHLLYGGLLVYIIPYYRLTPDVCRILTDNFDDLSVWRFTDAEFKKFKQVAVLGLRKRMSKEAADTRFLERFAARPEELRLITELEEGRYALPAESHAVELFRGQNFNKKELERQLQKSDSFSRLLARKELDRGTKRPLLPLSIGQVGLIGGSGMINGLIDCDTPHIIKGRIVKEKRVESEEKFDAKGRHMGTEVRETFTNKMIFNVLTPSGFKALT